MLVFALDSNGEPNAFFCLVTGTQEQLDSGDFYLRAEQAAELEGYGFPMIAADENDPAGHLCDKFVWESATTYQV